MELTFGEKIREARKSQNLTQKQLAERIGAKHNSVSDWENNKNKPDPDTIELLCGILKITPNYLLASSSEDFSPHEKQMIKKYRNLSPSGQKHVDAVLEWETEHMEQLKQAASAPAAKPRCRLIQYYQRLASAGTGQYVFDSIPTEQIEIPDIPEYRKVQFALGVNGLSMEPIYSHGDILLIEPTQEVQPGEIGIFLHNGESFVKELGDGVLHSLNDLYDDIELTEDTRCVGRVIDKLDAPISVSEELGEKLRALAKKVAEKHA